MVGHLFIAVPLSPATNGGSNGDASIRPNGESVRGEVGEEQSTCHFSIT